MRIVKSFAPILILLTLSGYAYLNYVQLPVSIINGIVFLPHLLAILTIALAVHFNRSLVFFYVLLIIAVNLVLKFGWADSRIGLSVLGTFVPILLLVFSLIPEKGVISERAVPAYLVLFVSAGLASFIVVIHPVWASGLFLNDWLPTQYFDWTTIPQSVFLVFVIVCIGLLILFFLNPSPHTAAGFGVLILLLCQLQFNNESKSLIVFSGIALLMCLYAILQESWRMAYLDELTGIPGRRALREKFQQLGGVYSIAMLDVDHFKKFNDRHGHETGDSILRMIAGKMQKVTGGGFAFRYGGEEFALVFNNKDAQESRPHLETLRESIAEALFVVNRANRRSNDKQTKQKKQKTVKVSVSIGISDSNAKADNPWDVLKLADKALYRAKKKGRNCVVA